jgi:hypothetical protein
MYKKINAQKVVLPGTRGCGQTNLEELIDVRRSKR